VKLFADNLLFVGERTLIIGDAAGLTEPLSGEGIFYAVRSAQLAANVILDVLSNPSLGLDKYEKFIDEVLMPMIQQAKAYVWIFNRKPRFFITRSAVEKNYGTQRSVCYAEKPIM
jgi:flavin-dependent dehydrogenase